MSAPSTHHHSSQDSSSGFWSIFNIVLAVVIGGFALFWGAALLIQGARYSSGNLGPAETVTASAPAEQTQATGAATEVLIKVDPANPMAFDTKQFTVKSGAPVRITFENTHPVPMPHNLVIGALGSKEKLFGLAMTMAADPQGMAKGYIPEAPEVLFHTKLLQPNTKETLEFTAPAAGDYPYLCTFPGHGAIMNGVMRVE